MLKKISRPLIVALALFQTGVGVQALQAQEQNNTLQKKVIFELRPRWEYVDVENNNRETANAATVRARLGFEVKYKFLKFYVENTLVSAFTDKYAPLDGGYEVVPDEPQFRFTQLWVGYNNNLLDFKFGRQVINLDNQRFIGAVNWRQTPQTFDAARLDIRPIKGLTFTTAYICSRQGVLDSLSTDICSDEPINHSAVLHLSYTAFKPVKISAYAYHFNDVADTYGANFKGNYSVMGISFNYWAEYAHQIVHNDARNIYDTADYYHLKLGSAVSTAYGKPFFNVGYEYLGQHFVTPLATLHAFNGWADVFLKYTAGSNAYGLKDLYLTLGYQHSRFGKFQGVLHKFTAPEDFPGGGDEFGTEIDLLWAKKITKNLSVVAKYAKYDASSEAKNAGVGANDVTKAWLMLTYSFSRSF
ncbi:MAG: alginate export family protein [Aquificota bacterium]